MAPFTVTQKNRRWDDTRGRPRTGGDSPAGPGPRARSVAAAVRLRVGDVHVAGVALPRHGGQGVHDAAGPPTVQPHHRTTATGGRAGGRGGRLLPRRPVPASCGRGRCCPRSATGSPTDSRLLSESGQGRVYHRSCTGPREDPQGSEGKGEKQIGGTLAFQRKELTMWDNSEPNFHRPTASLPP
jgi:hypothetical protein